MSALETDVREVKEDVKGIRQDMRTVLDFISEETGARKERDKSDKRQGDEISAIRAQQNFQIEITWTKVMALAAMIGSVTGVIALAPHFVFHAY